MDAGATVDRGGLPRPGDRAGQSHTAGKVKVTVSNSAAGVQSRHSIDTNARRPASGAGSARASAATPRSRVGGAGGAGGAGQPGLQRPPSRASVAGNSRGGPSRGGGRPASRSRPLSRAGSVASAGGRPASRPASTDSGESAKSKANDSDVKNAEHLLDAAGLLAPLRVHNAAVRVLRHEAWHHTASDIKAIMEYLGHLRFFQAMMFGGTRALSEEERMDLVRHLQLREYSNNQIIFRQGSKPTGLYVIIRGRVDVLKLEKSEEDELFGDRDSDPDDDAASLAADGQNGSDAAGDASAGTAKHASSGQQGVVHARTQEDDAYGGSAMAVVAGHAGATSVQDDNFGEVVATLTAGDAFGEAGLLEARPRNATIVSVSDDCQTIFIDRDLFERCRIGERPVVWHPERCRALLLKPHEDRTDEDLHPLVNLCEENDFFKDQLDKPLIKAIAAHMQYEKRGKYSIVCRQGEPGDVFYIVLSGRLGSKLCVRAASSCVRSTHPCSRAFAAANPAAVFKESVVRTEPNLQTTLMQTVQSDGDAQFLAQFMTVYGGCDCLLYDGDAFGQTALLSARAFRTASIMTLEPTELITLSKDAFDLVMAASAQDVVFSLNSCLRILRTDPVDRTPADMDFVYVNLVPAVPFLANLNPSAARRACRWLQIKDLEPRDVLFRQGAVADTLYVVRKGSLSAHHRGAGHLQTSVVLGNDDADSDISEANDRDVDIDAKPVAIRGASPLEEAIELFGEQVALYKHGDAFDEAPLLRVCRTEGESTYDTTVVATEVTEVLYVTLPHFRQLIFPDAERLLFAPSCCRTTLQLPPEQRSDAQLSVVLRCLSYFEFFRQLPEALQMSLARIAKYRSYQRGQLLVRQGAPDTMLQVLLRGSATLHDTSKPPNEARAKWIRAMHSSAAHESKRIRQDEEQWKKMQRAHRDRRRSEQLAEEEEAYFDAKIDAKSDVAAARKASIALGISLESTFRKAAGSSKSAQDEAAAQGLRALFTASAPNEAKMAKESDSGADGAESGTSAVELALLKAARSSKHRTRSRSFDAARSGLSAAAGGDKGTPLTAPPQVTAAAPNSRKGRRRRRSRARQRRRGSSAGRPTSGSGSTKESAGGDGTSTSGGAADTTSLAVLFHGSAHARPRRKSFAEGDVEAEERHLRHLRGDFSAHLALDHAPRDIASSDSEPDDDHAAAAAAARRKTEAARRGSVVVRGGGGGSNAASRLGSAARKVRAMVSVSDSVTLEHKLQQQSRHSTDINAVDTDVGPEEKYGRCVGMLAPGDGVGVLEKVELSKVQPKKRSRRRRKSAAAAVVAAAPGHAAEGNEGDHHSGLYDYTAWAREATEALVVENLDRELFRAAGNDLVLAPALCRRLLRSPPFTREKHEIALLFRLARSVSFFSQFTDNTVRDLCQVMSLQTYDAHRLVVKQGTEGETFYILLTGSVFIHIERGDDQGASSGAGIFRVKSTVGGARASAADNRRASLASVSSMVSVADEIPGPETVVGRMFAGDSFGERALLGDGRRTASITTAEFSEFITISKAPFLAAIEGLKQVTYAPDTMNRTFTEMMTIQDTLREKAETVHDAVTAAVASVSRPARSDAAGRAAVRTKHAAHVRAEIPAWAQDFRTLKALRGWLVDLMNDNAAKLSEAAAKQQRADGAPPQKRRRSSSRIAAALRRRSRRKSKEIVVRKDPQAAMAEFDRVAGEHRHLLCQALMVCGAIRALPEDVRDNLAEDTELASYTRGEYVFQTPRPVDSLLQAVPVVPPDKLGPVDSDSSDEDVGSRSMLEVLMSRQAIVPQRRTREKRKDKVAETAIVERREYAGYLYCVLSGTVTITTDMGVRLATLRDGDTFGEFECFAGVPWQTAAKVLSDCRVAKLRRAAVVELCRTHPHFAPFRRYSALASADLFAGLNEHDKAYLYNVGDLCTLEHKDVLFSQGEPAVSIGVVIRGSFRLLRRSGVDERSSRDSTAVQHARRGSLSSVDEKAKPGRGTPIDSGLGLAINKPGIAADGSQVRSSGERELMKSSASRRSKPVVVELAVVGEGQVIGAPDALATDAGTHGNRDPVPLRSTSAVSVGESDVLLMPRRRIFSLLSRASARHLIRRVRDHAAWLLEHEQQVLSTTVGALHDASKSRNQLVPVVRTRVTDPQRVSKIGKASFGDATALSPRLRANIFTAARLNPSIAGPPRESTPDVARRGLLMAPVAPMSQNRFGGIVPAASDGMKGVPMLRPAEVVSNGGAAAKVLEARAAASLLVVDKADGPHFPASLVFEWAGAASAPQPRKVVFEPDKHDVEGADAVVPQRRVPPLSRPSSTRTRSPRNDHASRRSSTSLQSEDASVVSPSKASIAAVNKLQQSLAPEGLIAPDNLFSEAAATEWRVPVDVAEEAQFAQAASQAAAAAAKQSTASLEESQRLEISKFAHMSSVDRFFSVPHRTTWPPVKPNTKRVAAPQRPPGAAGRTMHTRGRGSSDARRQPTRYRPEHLNELAQPKPRPWQQSVATIGHSPVRTSSSTPLVGRAGVLLPRKPTGGSRAGLGPATDATSPAVDNSGTDDSAESILRRIRQEAARQQRAAPRALATGTYAATAAGGEYTPGEKEDLVARLKRQMGVHRSTLEPPKVPPRQISRYSRRTIMLQAAGIMDDGTRDAEWQGFYTSEETPS